MIAVVDWTRPVDRAEPDRSVPFPNSQTSPSHYFSEPAFFSVFLLVLFPSQQTCHFLLAQWPHWLNLMAVAHRGRVRSASCMSVQTRVWESCLFKWKIRDEKDLLNNPVPSVASARAFLWWELRWGQLWVTLTMCLLTLDLEDRAVSLGFLFSLGKFFV